MKLFLLRGNRRRSFAIIKFLCALHIFMGGQTKLLSKAFNELFHDVTYEALSRKRFQNITIHFSDITVKSIDRNGKTTYIENKRKVNQKLNK